TSTAFTTLYGTAPITWRIDTMTRTSGGNVTETSTNIRLGSTSGLVTTGDTTPVGIYTVTIRATDARGDFETTTLQVRVNDSITISGATSLTTTYSRETTTTYTASGGTTSASGGSDTYTYFISRITKGASTNIDTATATISIDPSTGVLTILGTTAHDTYTIIIQARDQFGETGTRTLTLRVNESVAVSGAASIITTEGRETTTTFTASLGTGPYTYQILQAHLHHDGDRYRCCRR
ncbi:MAG: hypothetical protein EBY74_06275, partial [Actinobacteria bacterium]|nr:hypothetical protein [Actinomycetota bacterium]